VGSEAVASFVAHVAFWFLLAYVWLAQTLEIVPAAIFVALWIVGAVGMPYLPYEPARAMFSSFVACSTSRSCSSSSRATSGSADSA
jgi:hypothetical protein